MHILHKLLYKRTGVPEDPDKRQLLAAVANCPARAPTRRPARPSAVGIAKQLMRGVSVRRPGRDARLTKPEPGARLDL